MKRLPLQAAEAANAQDITSGTLAGAPPADLFDPTTSAPAWDGAAGLVSPVIDSRAALIADNSNGLNDVDVQTSAIDLDVDQAAYVPGGSGTSPAVLASLANPAADFFDFISESGTASNVSQISHADLYAAPPGAPLTILVSLADTVVGSSAAPNAIIGADGAAAPQAPQGLVSSQSTHAGHDAASAPATTAHTFAAAITDAAASAAQSPAAADIDGPLTSDFSLQYKGFDYVAFYNGAYENSDSLPSLVQTGANSIEATLDYGIDAQTSQVVADPNYTDSLTALGTTIAQAEGLGLSVMVRPLIDFLNPTESAPYSVGEWRQDYQPANVGAFFASYRQMIVAEAEVAQANGAQMLSIGAELDQLTGAQYLPYWTDIINSVRAVFSGALTYSASWNTASEVSFWNQLNYEGIDCYVPLSNAPNPTLQQLVNGWLDPATSSTNPGAYAVIGNQSPIQYFENLAAQSGKPLIFTELGYANDSGAAADPAASGNSPDPALQAELYQAFFQAWTQSGSSSLVGTYFWEWDPNGSPSNVGPGIDSFSPQNSPAQGAAAAGFEAAETIANGATLEIAGADSGSVAFQGSTGLLKLDAAQTFSGQVFNFTGNGTLSGSDQIDLKDIVFGPGTTASYAGTVNAGTLTVDDAQGDVANISLVGNCGTSTFSVFSDGGGGTVVIAAPVTRPLASGTLFFDGLNADVAAVTVSPQNAGSGYVGSFTADPANAANGEVSWYFDLGTEAITQTVTQSYEVTAADGQPNGTATRPFSVTVGGPGNDTFAFSPGFGWDVIANATSADKIELDGFSSGSINELATLLQEAQSGQPQLLFQPTHGGKDTVIHPGDHDRITLINVHLAELHAYDFIIH